MPNMLKDHPILKLKFLFQMFFLHIFLLPFLLPKLIMNPIKNIKILLLKTQLRNKLKIQQNQYTIMDKY